MMVMNGAKLINYSDDKLSRFIYLITNVIHTPIPTQRFVRVSIISISVEFTSQTNNDDDEEEHDNKDHLRREEQTMRISPPVNQQLNSNQRTLRSETRVNDRQMNDSYSRESRLL